MKNLGLPISGIHRRALIIAGCFLASCGVPATKDPGSVGGDDPGGDDPGGADPVIGRGTEYLAREVTAWPEDNRCFSCHNSGDGWRALCAADPVIIRGADFRATIDWLEHPARWERSHRPGSEDPKLAKIQFFLALSAAVAAGASDATDASNAARDAVLELQEKDGSWTLDPERSVGSPTTYGSQLATAEIILALRDATKSRASSRDVEQSLARAMRWLAKAPVRNVPEAAAVARVTGQGRAIDVLHSMQDPASGGWGPFATSAPEIFDTALALLTLASVQKTEESEQAIRRGRAYLVANQLAGGGWPETTRPADQTSYAQSISTSAWALRALVATRDAAP